MLTRSVKLVVLALAVAASCGQGQGLSPGGRARLEGVLDASSLAAMRGQSMRVSVVGTQRSTTIDPAGRFTLSDLPAGEVILRFEARGIDVTVRISGLLPNQTLQITVTITAAGGVVVTQQNQIAFVGAIDAVAKNKLTISGLEVDVGEQTRIVARGKAISFSDLKVNQIVRVRGMLESGKVLANVIHLLLPADLDRVFIRGTIDSIDAPKFKVAGLTIVTDSETVFPGRHALADFKVGDRVVVKGTLQGNGTVKATLVVDAEAAPARMVEIEGKITEIMPPDRFKVAGVTVVVNAATRIEAEDRKHHGEHALTFADLRVGDRVEVEGVAQPDAGTVLALRIEVEEEEEKEEPDAGMPDAGAHDGGVPDAGVPDGGRQ